MTMRCAVFASGGGSNFGALLDRQQAGDLHVEFVILISNNSSAGAFERARNHQIRTLHLAPSHFDSGNAYTAKLMSVLTEHRIELIILAGYMKKLPPEVVRAFHNRIVNIHPGLLPAFGGKGMYGSKLHEAVIAYGAKVTGVTVHFTDEEYDHGPVILQKTLDVLDNDDAHSLSARVLKLEHQTYWRAIEAIAQGRLTIDGRRVLGAI